MFSSKKEIALFLRGIYMQKKLRIESSVLSKKGRCATLLHKALIQNFACSVGSQFLQAGKQF